MNEIKNEKKTFYGVNALLNKPGHESTAAIAFTIEKSFFNEFKKEKPSLDAYEHLYISDCNKTIALSLCFEDENELENSIQKLKTIEDVCYKIGQELKRAFEYNEGIRKYNEKIKEEEK